MRITISHLPQYKPEVGSVYQFSEMVELTVVRVVKRETYQTVVDAKLELDTLDTGDCE